MAMQTKSMTTSEFAKATGIPAATVSKLIREGKLKARKEGRSWMIPQSQLEAKAVRELGRPAKTAKTQKAAKPAPAPKAAKPIARHAGTPAAPPRPPAAAAPLRPKPEAASRSDAQSSDKLFSVGEFAAMTYLTEKGVSQWLKNGRLKGKQKGDGQWEVYGSNLLTPGISRLVRK
jgi:excisionase family DNA binding protein